MPQPTRIAVVLASAGRPALLADVLQDIEAQTLTPTWTVVSVPNDESLPAGGLAPHIIRATARGLAAQRNAGIAMVPDAEVVFFFDDDAVVRRDYLERAVEVFGGDPSIVGLSGTVLLDGAASTLGSEVPLDTARAAIAESLATPLTARSTPRRTLYGCNFAYRQSSTDALFDGRLPLYSWLEDHDVARRVMRDGRLVTAHDCVIVHRGAKTGGREAHTRLGYSQVMNPLYFRKKGSFPVWLTIWEVGQRVGKNVAYSVAGSQSAWRRERLAGNVLAAKDVLRGRYTPERAVELD